MECSGRRRAGVLVSSLHSQYSLSVLFLFQKHILGDRLGRATRRTASLVHAGNRWHGYNMVAACNPYFWLNKDKSSIALDVCHWFAPAAIALAAAVVTLLQVKRRCPWRRMASRCRRVCDVLT